MVNFEQWNGFDGSLWKEEVNVRDFIQKNYTPYDGDESFLAGPTEATDKLWGALQKLQKAERAKGGVLDMETEVVEVVKAAKKLVDLIGADFIVSVGRGISKDVEGGIKLAEELADVLGGVVGGSRATIDSGWLSADHQVGQTGKTVHPRIYVALGISGAIQHKAGMQDSECIIAVNKNESAPIFEVADYGIVGDLFKVVPELIKQIEAAKAAQ